MMKLLVAFFSLAVYINPGVIADVPVKTDWKTLSNVDFNKKWNKEEKMFILEPVFGEAVKELAGKTVEITGYMIPIDIESNYYVLSANPFASCFFCGGAGPESVMSIKFKKVSRRFDTDERLTLKGKLVLNTKDLEELNYILQDAELIK